LEGDQPEQGEPARDQHRLQAGARGGDPAAAGLLLAVYQLRHVSGLVERAPDHARVVTGGKQAGERGYFYEPT
jgi:betaine-aldehyde dehydrogenase